VLFQGESDGGTLVVDEFYLGMVGKSLPAMAGFGFDDEVDLAIVAVGFVERLEDVSRAILEGEDQTGIAKGDALELEPALLNNLVALARVCDGLHQHLGVARKSLANRVGELFAVRIREKQICHGFLL